MIYYKRGYKYQLTRDLVEQTAVFPEDTVSTRFIKLTPAGVLTIRADYAWNGPSGITVDTPDSIRGSAVHDALYQLFALGLLDAAVWREAADGELLRICTEAGMLGARAGYWYAGVRVGGANHLSDNPELTAP